MSGKFDELLGRGGASEFLTNWNAARDFVRNNIKLNPRLDDIQRANLYRIEEEAYDLNHSYLYSGSIIFDPLAITNVQTREQQIRGYYEFILKEFPVITNDQRFINVFRSAVGASIAVTTDVSKPEDLFKPNKNMYIIIGLAALILLTRK
jgi:hypothetical protein